jgi:hypothetical protein
MKKMFLGLIGLMFFVGSVVAQHPRRGERTDAEARAKHQTERLTKDLGLNETTSKKAFDLALARAKKMDEIMASSAERLEKMKLGKANQETFENKMKEILTADQFKKFKEIQEEQKRRGGPRGRPERR